ncbi:MAG: CDP-diacylglycerol--serine O-phosphatidyltransferase [Selenomonadaceae bacterium]|nr:CDP-diacylglycerol--serine O-phosphatidyltransferase [Selenomonadaceae bacterium]
MKHLIPNACTSMNLVFGMCSIISTFNGNYLWASLFILLALVADGLDGRAARFFGVSSELGKEMDSLCDLGSFGIAPALLAYKFTLSNYGHFGEAVAIVFALCGMWRLARFNVNTNVVHGFFMGLAIPAGGCIVATSTMLLSALSIKPEAFGYVYPVTMLIVAYLMVSHVHYPDFKGGGEKLYLIPKIAAAVFLVGIIYLGRDALLYAVLTAVFSAYALFGILNSLYTLFSKK